MTRRTGKEALHPRVDPGEKNKVKHNRARTPKPAPEADADVVCGTNEGLPIRSTKYKDCVITNIRRGRSGHVHADVKTKEGELLVVAATLEYCVHVVGLRLP